MAIVRMYKITPQMPSKSHSLVSTGRSRVEEGEEINSNPLKSSYKIANPFLCHTCDKRFKTRNDLFTHVKIHLNLRPRPVVNPSLTETPPTPPPTQPQPEPKPDPDPWPEGHLPVAPHISNPPLPLPEHLRRPHFSSTQLESHVSEPVPERNDPEPMVESVGECEPDERRGPGGLITKQLLMLISDPQPKSQKKRRRRIRGPDLTLRVGLKARRGRPRTRPLTPRAYSGPTRQCMWFKEYANNLRLAGDRVGTILDASGSNIDPMASLFQTLSDEELELKLGI